jgi:hypothetical protein
MLLQQVKHFCAAPPHAPAAVVQLCSLALTCQMLGCKAPPLLLLPPLLLVTASCSKQTITTAPAAIATAVLVSLAKLAAAAAAAAALAPHIIATVPQLHDTHGYTTHWCEVLLLPMPR